MARITAAPTQDLRARTPFVRLWRLTARGPANDLTSRAEVPRLGCGIVFPEAKTTAEDRSPVAHSTLSYGRPAE